MSPLSKMILRRATDSRASAEAEAAAAIAAPTACVLSAARSVNGWAGLAAGDSKACSRCFVEGCPWGAWRGAACRVAALDVVDGLLLLALRWDLAGSSDRELWLQPSCTAGVIFNFQHASFHPASSNMSAIYATR